MALTDAELGFILVVCAGLATSIGAGVVYSTSLIKFTSKNVLASALGLSAGVMLYVSFIEIFAKSLGAFEDAGFSPSDAYLYATLCFFGGVILMRTINYFVHWLDPSHMSHEDFDFDVAEEVMHRDEEDNHPVLPDNSNEFKIDHDKGGLSSVELLAAADRKGNSDKMENMLRDGSDTERDEKPLGQDMSSNEAVRPVTGTTAAPPAATSHPTDDAMSRSSHNIGDKDSYRELSVGGKEADEGMSVTSTSPPNVFDAEEQRIQREERLVRKKHLYDKRLKRMGMFTALAIAIHNFPEGLATFIGTLNDPAVGAALAVAIAIHNIPEGLCVSVPIYFATNNRNKAFWWGFLSGISEIVGAGLGWLVLKDVFSDVIFAVLFGLVAGMMVCICVYELLPTARRYDPKDTCVSNSAVVGMAIMALSLVVFLY